MTHMEAGRPRESYVTATRAGAIIPAGLRDCCQIAALDGIDPWDHHTVCAGRAEDLAEQAALFGRSDFLETTSQRGPQL